MGCQKGVRVLAGLTPRRCTLAVTAVGVAEEAEDTFGAAAVPAVFAEAGEGGEQGVWVKTGETFLGVLDTGFAVVVAGFAEI